MRPKKKALTAAQYSRIERLQGWKVFGIPRVDWNAIPGLTRLEDTIAIMGSADYNDPRLLNSIQAVAGFDQLVYESNPKPGEPSGNAYHFVVQRSNRQDYPYILHGPFKSETRVKHWFDADDLEVYWMEETADESS